MAERRRLAAEYLYLLERGGFEGLGRGGRPLPPGDLADLEETYHARIFREIVRLFGLGFELREPPRGIRRSVRIMAHLPERLSFTLLGAGELMGTVAFLGLLNRAEALLAGHPRHLARVRELLDELLIDEIGHVTYLLGTMAGWQLAIVRTVARAYLLSTRRGYRYEDRAETAYITRGIASDGLGLFPERVLRRAFVPRGYWPETLAA